MTNKGKAVLCHVGGFLGNLFFLGNIIVVFIIWLISRDDPFVDRHGKEALNYQLSMTLYIFLLLSAAFTGLLILGIGAPAMESLTLLILGLFFSGGGFIILAVLFIAEVVFVIKASVRASNGEDYAYPLTIRFVK